MKSISLTLLAAATVLFSTIAIADAPGPDVVAPPQLDATTPEELDEIRAKPNYDPEGHSFGHKLLFYIPNRIFDVLDIVRVRGRVGPGIAIGVRATDVVQLYFGSYLSLWGGLPGPRMEPRIPWPGGKESLNGASVSILQDTFSEGADPEYSPTEFGLSLQAVVVGADVGVDPVELLDLLTGLVFFDVRNDDL